MQTVIEVTEQVTQADSGTYRVYSFEIPADTTAVYLDFVVEPAQIGEYAQAVKVVLFSPDGLRGTPGRHALPARLTDTTATCGFGVGPLTPGTWRAEVSMEYVLADQPCSYRLRVDVEQGAGKSSLPMSPGPLRRRFADVFPDSIEGKSGPGWYAGDLHMHTTQSDGRWSPADLVRAIQQRGLDFFVVTDHNIQWALPDVAAELTAQGVGAILAIPGVEVSTRSGHLLAIGAETWIDWRLGHWPDRTSLTIGEIVRRVHDAGALAIIAHPGAVGSPSCHGCHWELDEVDPASIDAVEAWNGPWLSEKGKNESSLSYWEQWRTQGFAHPLTGGSDAHGGGIDFQAGVPTTYVFAQGLTRPAILAGLRAGRIVISSGPELRFYGYSDVGVSCGPGEAMQITPSVTLEATVSGAQEPARLVLRGQAGRVADQMVNETETLSIQAQQLSPGWYLAELRSAATDALLAIANPIILHA